MFNKKQNISFIFLFTVLFFRLLAENSSVPLNEFTNELKRSFDNPKTLSFELALQVLQQGYEVCTAIDKIDPKISSQLGVKCKVCKNVLSCAEFAGNLLAVGDIDQLNSFKLLLAKAEVQVINFVLLNGANEQQITCPMCGKFEHWVEMDASKSN